MRIKFRLIFPLLVSHPSPRKEKLLLPQYLGDIKKQLLRLPLCDEENTIFLRKKKPPKQKEKTSAFK
jgi:hypothetical protein